MDWRGWRLNVFLNELPSCGSFMFHGVSRHFPNLQFDALLLSYFPLIPISSLSQRERSENQNELHQPKVKLKKNFGISKQNSEHERDKDY